MSIKRLHSDAWEHILSFLDASDTIRLLLTGDTTLRTSLKPAFREFVVCFRTLTSPSLYHLLSIFKDSSSNPVRFSISLGTYYYRLPFLMEDYRAPKWKKVFCENLRTLELALPCDKPPFTSFLASLANIAPQLTKLRIHSFTEDLTLPQSSLTWLELGTEAHYSRGVHLESSYLIESLPTTLTHLKFFETIYVEGEIDVSKLPFRKMPLTVFHGNISFQSLRVEQACWSILPNTITDLQSELSCDGENLFPRPRSWKQLFPNLTSLNVRLDVLAETSLIKNSDGPDGRLLSDEQIESIRSCFPNSLTALETYSLGLIKEFAGLPLVVCALGDRLTSYTQETAARNTALKWLPKWVNPNVGLLKTRLDELSNRSVLAESENFETFASGEKEHPISLLYRNATYLDASALPASAISFLPKTITSLSFDSLPQEPLSQKIGSEIFERLKTPPDASELLSSTLIDIKTQNFNPNSGYIALGWPPGLTNLKISLHHPQPLHWGCLPPTLTKCVIYAYQDTGSFSTEGDMSHISKLSTLELLTGPYRLVTTTIGLPRSLRSLISGGWLLTDPLFFEPEMKKFFSNLEIMDLGHTAYSPDILLYLPMTLKALRVAIIQTDVCLGEKHFESIFQTKLISLNLRVRGTWPDGVRLDVFGRLMPITLAKLHLQIDSIENEKIEEIAKHIPVTLLQFFSPNMMLQSLVQARIDEYRSS